MVAVECGADGKVRSDFTEIDHRRFDPHLVDHGAVTKFRQVAPGFSEAQKEFRLQVEPSSLSCQLQHTPSVLHDLDSLYTAKFVKEPAAAGVHQHGVPLHF